jgi:hypothetical protein
VIYQSIGLTFWQRINAFRESCLKMPTTNEQYDAIIDDANNIMETFVISGAPLEINISSAQRDSVRDTLAHRVALLRTFMATNHSNTPRLDGLSISTPTSIRRGIVPLPFPSSANTYMVERPSPTITPASPLTNGEMTLIPNNHVFPLLSSLQPLKSGHKNSASVTLTNPPTTITNNGSPNGVTTNGNSPRVQRFGPRAISPSLGLGTSPRHVERINDIVSPLVGLSAIFDDAQSTCIQLLQKGAFMRFTTSIIFRSFIEGLHNGNSSKQAMEQAMSRIQVGSSLDASDGLSSIRRGSVLAAVGSRHSPLIINSTLPRSPGNGNGNNGRTTPILIATTATTSSNTALNSLPPPQPQSPHQHISILSPHSNNSNLLDRPVPSVISPIAASQPLLPGAVE